MPALQMGVAVPLKNTKFRYGTTIRRVLSTSGPTKPGEYWQFVITEVTPYLAQVMSAGEHLLVGPSTHSDYKGLVETFEIASIETGGIINVVGTPAYSYLAGDPVTMTGDLLASNWTPSSNDTTKVQPSGIRDDSWGIQARRTGTYDEFFQQVTLERDQYLYQRIPAKYFLPSTQYIFGCFYQVSFLDPDSPTMTIALKMDLNNSSGNQGVIGQTLRRPSDGSVSTWTHIQTSTKSQAQTEDAFEFDPINPGGGVTPDPVSEAEIRWPQCSGGALTVGKRTVIRTDCPYLCHAQLTEDYREGIYTFREDPVLGSRAWEVRGSEIEIELANSDTIQMDATGNMGRRRKHTFSCDFENVKDSFLMNLQRFMEWQRKGNLLVLITQEHNYSSAHPPVLIGRMALTRSQPRHWDLARRSFSLTFNEV